MLAYTLKNVVELIPESLDMVKQASITQEYPVDSKDSTIASALAIEYDKYLTNRSVDPDVMTKVASAVELYGVKSEVDHLCSQLQKAAYDKAMASLQDPVKEYHVKEAGFIGDLSGFSDPESRNTAAVELYKSASAAKAEPCEQVRRYSGNAYLSKAAAVSALASRYKASGEVGFAKIAAALGRMSESGFKTETVQDICRTVTSMDKQAGLHLRGYDFYREALLTKEAELVSALRVKLAGSDVPYESIHKVGKDRIAQYIGADVAREMDSGPAHFKQVLETLPLDLQRLVVDLTKNA